MILVVALACFFAAGLETDPEFKKGQDQIDAFDYEKATATFDKVSKRPGLTDADRAVALVWLGLAYAELRDQAHASVAFEDAVTADPLIVLPRDASPKIKTLLEDARARVRARPKAPPTTTTTPTDGTPPNNGNDTGNPPPPDAPPPQPQPEGNILVPVAIGTAVVGGVVAVAGGAVWAVGLGLRQQAIEAKFQSDAAALREQSVATQIGGQVAGGVGVAALVAGGVLFAVTALE